MMRVAQVRVDVTKGILAKTSEGPKLYNVAHQGSVDATCKQIKLTSDSRSMCVCVSATIVVN